MAGACFWAQAVFIPFAPRLTPGEAPKWSDAPLCVLYGIYAMCCAGVLVSLSLLGSHLIFASDAVFISGVCILLGSGCLDELISLPPWGRVAMLLTWAGVCALSLLGACCWFYRHPGDCPRMPKSRHHEDLCGVSEESDQSTSSDSEESWSSEPLTR
mmetsp:Transcript_73975/g.214278  ORF Transcript_73975/g.214278 Transcript_73975/m.214278 type:complete len:157 (+) Transcript_73975:3-473(+)